MVEQLTFLIYNIMTPNEQKEAIKEALEEWLDKQFSKFGVWSLKGIVAIALAGLVYLWAMTHGWSIK
jgi:hypothetical protein